MSRFSLQEKEITTLITRLSELCVIIDTTANTEKGIRMGCYECESGCSGSCITHCDGGCGSDCSGGDYYSPWR